VQNNPVNFVDPSGQLMWAAGGTLVGAGVNVAALYVSNYAKGGSVGDVSLTEVGSAALSGAIAGFIGTLGGPAGGTLAHVFGKTGNSYLSMVFAGAISAGGGYLGQSAANVIDPCHASDPLNAAFFSGIGGGIAKALPTKTLNTLSQAVDFGPSNVSGLFSSKYSAWFWGGAFSSAGIGSASYFGGPF
jgi:hypothetical protein